jgi:hypothetical protein
MSVPFARPYNVMRFSPGQYVNGTWQEGGASTFTVQASIQPLRTEELQALPEGLRSTLAVKIYSESMLYTERQATVLNEGTTTSADQIQFDDGNWYEIVATQPIYKAMLGLDHCKAHGILVQGGA